MAEFRFKIKGKSYSMPVVTAAQDKLDGGALMDASLAGEAGMLAYMFKALTAVADDDVIAALRALPQSDMLAILKDWGEFGDGDGASLGK